MTRKIGFNIQSKVIAFFRHQLTQGVSPKALALTLALALALGTFPVLGSTTLLCFLFGLVFSLNQPLIQALNYILYPLQIVLLPVFLNSGQRLFQEPEMVFDIQALMNEFRADPGQFFAHYTVAGLHGIVAWMFVMPLISFFVYFVAYSLIRKLLPKN